MGKKNGGVKTKTGNTSSGKRRLVQAKRALMRLTMKIARWKRNQGDDTKTLPKWRRKQHVRLRSRHNKWNTEGLERHAKVLQSIVSQGVKVS